MKKKTKKNARLSHKKKRLRKRSSTSTCSSSTLRSCLFFILVVLCVIPFLLHHELSHSDFIPDQLQPLLPGQQWKPHHPQQLSERAESGIGSSGNSSRDSNNDESGGTSHTNYSSHHDDDQRGQGNGNNAMINNTINSSSKPPLPIQGWDITGDVSWLLDFAIVGFPKTGTSTMMKYLGNNVSGIYIPDYELCHLGTNQQVKLFKNFYKRYQPHLRMGLKCPNTILNTLAKHNYDKYLPKTKYIVGLRHPTLWFESFYNFRVTNGLTMPQNTKTMIGKCRPHRKNVCTDGANFTMHLAIVAPSRPIFLYDLAQLKDKNATRVATFRKDLQQFLELDAPLSEDMVAIKPGKKAKTIEIMQEIESKQINICDSSHDAVRNVLQQVATENADWLEDTFVKQINVRISSPEYFKSIMADYRRNPCDTRAVAVK